MSSWHTGEGRDMVLFKRWDVDTQKEPVQPDPEETKDSNLDVISLLFLLLRTFFFSLLSTCL